MRPEQALDRLLARGFLPLRPTYVRRLYPDGGRLPIAHRPGGTYMARWRMWRPERWIGSTVPARNPRRIVDEGISHLDVPGLDLPLPVALQLRGKEILGARHYAAYGSDFPVLVKVLDPGQTISFHFHARDVDVWKHPRWFGGQRFGKDEAYYFLDAPKGPIPYTHVGLLPGTTQRDLADAIAEGGGRVLELSPVVHQKIGAGFFVPSGVPHRPGTALTLEVQQPSDVSTMLERVSAGRVLSEREMHPGFASLRQALAIIDYKTACDPTLVKRCALTPEPVREAQSRGGDEEWIFPPRFRKFSGKRLVVRTRVESHEDGPYLALVWRGRGRLNGARIRAGAEFLVTAAVATREHVYEAEGGPMEIFKIFPPAPQHYQKSPLSPEARTSRVPGLKIPQDLPSWIYR